MTRRGSGRPTKILMVIGRLLNLLSRKAEAGLANPRGSGELCTPSKCWGGGPSGLSGYHSHHMDPQKYTLARAGRTSGGQPCGGKLPLVRKCSPRFTAKGEMPAWPGVGEQLAGCPRSGKDTAGTLTPGTLDSDFGPKTGLPKGVAFELRRDPGASVYRASTSSSLPSRNRGKICP